MPSLYLFLDISSTRTHMQSHVLHKQDAKKALDEALAITMSAYGAEHGATTEALNNLGQINRLLGNHDEAEALLIEALQLRRKLCGDYHVQTASTLNNLAELMRERGDFFQAVNYHNAAIESFMVGDVESQGCCFFG
jgi:tetratricopeptide (TPR) repeat protein